MSSTEATSFSKLLRQLRFAATDAMFSRGEGRRAYPDAVPGSIAAERAARQDDRVRRVQRWAQRLPQLDGYELSRRRPGPGAILLSFAVIDRAKLGRFLPAQILVDGIEFGMIRVG